MTDQLCGVPGVEPGWTGLVVSGTTASLAEPAWNRIWRDMPGETPRAAAWEPRTLFELCAQVVSRCSAARRRLRVRRPQIEEPVSRGRYRLAPGRNPDWWPVEWRGVNRG